MKIARFILLLLLVCSQVTVADELIIEPDAGREPILNAINQARSSVELVIYGFTDQSLMHAFIQAKNAQKHVAILLEPHPYKSDNENENAIRTFQTANLSLRWPDPQFKLLHQKTLILDHQRAIVMTFNFTHATFKNERNFALILDNPALVNEIDRVFIADSAHKTIAVKEPNLVWSPNNAREKILNLIRDAHSSLSIYAEDLSDYQIVGALAKAAHDGVKIKVLLSVNPQKFSSKKFAYLTRAGVQLRNSHRMIIHAKVIIVDQQRALLGSINLTAPSMNNNRELSVITEDASVVKLLAHTFEHDWNSTEKGQFETFNQVRKNPGCTRATSFDRLSYDFHSHSRHFNYIRYIQRLVMAAFC